MLLSTIVSGFPVLSDQRVTLRIDHSVAAIRVVRDSSQVPMNDYEMRGDIAEADPDFPEK